MGGLVSKNVQSVTDSVTGAIKNRKRKRNDEDDSAIESLNTPKKKKLLTTSQYIYKALFKEEQSSDVTVSAMGKLWHLHKVYLCQSPYFASMFSGNWKETNDTFVNIKITDPNITIDSLNIVFGSLYLDEVELNPQQIDSTLAAATLFQLDGLIEKCAEVMCETTNAETAIAYYDAATNYGVTNVKTVAFQWLLLNLLPYISKNYGLLRKIEPDLMTALVSSKDLSVVQTEFSLYLVLRSWMFTKLFPAWNPDKNKIKGQIDPQTYFSMRKTEAPYLETEAGRTFLRPFQVLRVQNLLMHHIDVTVIRKDNIIPPSWLNGPLLQQWTHILQVDQNIDKGPTEVTEELFNSSCMRCGRVLEEQTYQKWRWTGFNFGLDLVFINDMRTLSVKRHHRIENERLLSLQVKRNFLIRVNLISFNKYRQIKCQQTSGIQSIALDKNEEVKILTMDRELTFPLIICVSLLTVTPTERERATTQLSPEPRTSTIGAEEPDNQEVAEST